MLEKFKKKFVGDRNFYIYVIGIVVPMILQNVVTNFVSLLDNIMVGRIGTEQMSGVAIVNQFIFVFNISIFGAVSGPGIFGSQYYGKKDYEGQRYTFRFRVLIGAIIMGIAIILFKFRDVQLISLYLTESESAGDIALTLASAREYLAIMLWCTIPFTFGQIYSSVVRECEETKIPMIAAFSAVGVNLILDYTLIFGKFGFPVMGVRGAAVATVIAKTIEALVVIIWVHTHKDKNCYIIGAYRGFKIPWNLVKAIAVKSAPLMLNEFLWAYGMAMTNQCYSVRGLNVVAAQNICGTMTNLFGVIYLQLGASISIIVGQRLGAGRLKEAKDYDNKLIAFSVGVCVCVAAIMLPVAQVFPYLYNTQDDIRMLATTFITIQACVMPLWSFSNACYFTLRSGGNTLITFVFDSVFTWVVMIPLVFTLTKFTLLPIVLIFFIVNFSEIIKVTMGYIMVKSNKWMNTIVE
ncbi:MAG: MATE family efflux transporter [Lachnospiraceae bacterium]|nr:MATE family efflux transporter [Candidatus Colinaster scatohippi]